jgi:hypothetical protein
MEERKTINGELAQVYKKSYNFSYREVSLGAMTIAIASGSITWI